MSALVPAGAIDTLLEPRPLLPLLERARVRPFEAVVLELQGVLVRAPAGRSRSPVRRRSGEVEAPHAHQDTVAALRRWRRGALGCAILGQSSRGHHVLRAAGPHEALELAPDEHAESELGPYAQAEAFDVAARCMAVHPADAVALCSTPRGVTAARAAGMGLVVGVDRHGGDRRRRLADAGAQQIIHDVFGLRFPRRLSSVLDHRPEFDAWRADRSVGLFIDFDATMDPVPSPALRAALEAIAERWPVGIVSGRDREDLEARVGVPDVLYAGAHGLDIAGRGLRRLPAEADRAQAELERAFASLEARALGLPGVQLERRRFSICIRHRILDAEAVAAMARAAREVLARTHLQLRKHRHGLELVPDVDWDEGRTLRFMLDALRLDPCRTFLVHIGGNEGDERARAALGGMGAAIDLGTAVGSTLADWSVGNEHALTELLTWLA